MQFTALDIPEVVLFEPRCFEDERGFFFESFNQKVFNEALSRSVSFVQDNHSKSVKGVLRGIHYQLPPMAQGKLVRVVQGKVLDVAIDLRKSSPTFGSWVGEILSAENRRQLWIPEGFGHAFITLSDTAEFLYKTTNFYAPEYERCIAWDSVPLAIDWQYNAKPNLSTKDLQGVPFVDADYFE